MTIQLEPLSNRQPSQCFWHLIGRNSLLRGLNDRRGSHSIAEWQHDHPALSSTRTRSEKEDGLHRHVSHRRALNDSKWVGMDDKPRKSKNQKRAQVQQLVPNDGDQSKRGREHNWIAGLKPMAWPTQPYVSSRTRSADDDQLHPEGLDKDELQWAL